MKKLCCILGVVGVISVIGAQLISSYEDVISNSVPKQEETHQEYQGYLDEMDKLYESID